jgi:hypothetical protein
MYVSNILYFTCHFFVHEQVAEENFDEILGEMGMGWIMRMAAKAVRPRVVISESGGKWSIKSETPFKTISLDFIPGISFDETTPDGREVKVTIIFNRSYELSIDFSVCSEYYNL